jgi:hypothetical protein
MLERADALHNHAFRIEALAQMLRALEALRADLAEMFGSKSALATAQARSALDDDALVWVQAGALPSDESATEHGPAFRETAALRNRAFRFLEAAIARHVRGVRT